MNLNEAKHLLKENGYIVENVSDDYLDDLAETILDVSLNPANSVHYDESNIKLTKNTLTVVDDNNRVIIEITVNDSDEICIYPYRGSRPDFDNMRVYNKSDERLINKMIFGYLKISPFQLGNI